MIHFFRAMVERLRDSKRSAVIASILGLVSLGLLIYGWHLWEISRSPTLVFELRVNNWAGGENDPLNQTTTSEIRVRPGEGIGPNDPSHGEPPFTLLKIIDKQHAQIRISKSLEYYYHPNRYAKKLGGVPVVVSSDKLVAYTPSCDAGTIYTIRILDVDRPASIRSDSSRLLASLSKKAELTQDDAGCIQEMKCRVDFSDEDLENISKLNNLRHLDLSGNSLITDAGIKHLGGQSRLLDLDLSRTNIGDTGLNAILGLKRLESLNLNHTKVTDKSVEQLQTIDSLETLALSAPGVSRQCIWNLRQNMPKCKVGYYWGVPWGKLHRPDGDFWPQQLLPAKNERDKRILNVLIKGGELWADSNGDIKEAMVVDVNEPPVYSPELTREILSLLIEFKTVEKLRFRPRSNPPTSKMPDEELTLLTKFKTLKDLDLFRHWLTETGCKNFLEFVQVERLNLSDAKIDGIGLTYLRNCQKLRELNLSGVVVTDADMAVIGSLKNLENLNLLGTKATDSGLKSLTGLENLRNLNIGWTKVTAEGAQMIQNELPNCSIKR